MIFTDERHGDDRAITRLDKRVTDRARIGADGDVRYLNRLSPYGKLAQNALGAFAQRRPPRQLNQSRLQVARGPQMELLGGLVVLEDGATVGADEIVRSRDDRVEHDIDVER